MVPVYRAGRQLIKVRALMALSVVVLALCLWWASHLARTYGTSPGDGGALAPLPQRLAWGGLVALFGVAAVAGMGLYGRLYAARIEVEPDRQLVHLATPGFFGTNRHVFRPADIGSARAHRDVNRGTLGKIVGHPTPTVDAPWMSVRIAGWRLPLIIDLQGEVLDVKLLRSLLSGRLC
jgi:hypothetical protein